MSLHQDIIKDNVREIIELLESDGEYVSKDIFLEREGELVGLHEIGLNDGPNWLRMESWANAYTLQFGFIASIFRIWGPIETTAEEMQAEGWKRVSPPPNWGKKL